MAADMWQRRVRYGWQIHVLALEIDIRIPLAASLKDRRQVVRSLLDRARSRLHVSAAEVGAQESHQRAVLGFAAVSSSAAEVEDVMDRVESLVWSRPDLEVVSADRSWLE